MIALVGRGIASLAGRMITRNPRLGKKIFDLLKRPKGITVYRGEPWKHTPGEIKKVANWMYGPTAKFGRGPSPLRHGAAGRWFTEDPKFASRFAGYTGFGNLGRIKSVTLSAKEAKLAHKLSDKIHHLGGDAGYRAGMVISKKALAKVKTDPVQTLIANFYKNLGIYRGKDGGLAQILNV